MKIALLIGVSTYQPGLNALPSAEKDVQKLQQVLQTPEIGGFEQVKSVVNPDPIEMQREIEMLFGDRDKDDLVFLFFTGHGIKDDSGKLYFATSLTQKTPKGELIKSTAVPASFVQEIMGNSRSRRQVLMLDCCFSGAFAEGMTAKDDGRVDVQRQLGGEGRAVLTSSTSSQYSFEQQGSDLSVYTRYIVEGIETGAADQDNDGDIGIDELHEYAKRKVQEMAPAMKPEIYAIKEGFTIKLARALVGDPKLCYRRDVERFAERGEISDIARMALDARWQRLRLAAEEAEAIETEVLKPYRTYRIHLRQYEQAFLEAVTQEFPLSDTTCADLDFLKNALALRNEDVRPIEGRILASRGVVPGTASSTPAVPTPLVSGAAPTERWEPMVQPLYQGQTGTVNAYSQFPAPEQGAAVSPYAPTAVAPRPRRNRWLLNLALVLLLPTGAAGAYWGVLWWRSQQQYGQQEAVLHRSEDLAAQQNWGEAIRTASQLSTTSPLYDQAQERINSWSNNLMQSAVAQFQSGNFDTAMNLLQTIPPGSPASDQFQAKRTELQQQWQNDQALLKKVQDVHLAVNDFIGARGLLNSFSTDYLKQQAEALITAREQSSAAFQLEQQQRIAAEAQRRAELERQRQDELRRQLENQRNQAQTGSPSNPPTTGANCYRAVARGLGYVNIRSGPNPETNRIGPSIGKLTDGQVIQATGATITALNDEQRQVQYIQITSPQQGWVSSEFAQPVGCPSGGGGGLL
jgi:hypothetical protein